MPDGACHCFKAYYLKQNYFGARRICMTTVKIKGMSCQHCVMAVTKALSGIEGVKNVQVDLKNATASYEEVKPVDAAVVAQAIKKAGYEVAG